MEIEVLGSGGAIPIPRALCACEICAEARLKGLPYARCGPSYFLHGPNILFDTPEEIRLQLARSNIRSIRACFYSHWHPDHVMGRRIFESNLDFRNPGKTFGSTDVYLPMQVAADSRRFLGTWEHLAFLESKNLVRLIELEDGATVDCGDVKVRPMRLAESYVYAFLIETAEGARALLAPDELYGWTPPEELRGVDVAILPMGMLEFHPRTGKRCIPEGHCAAVREATYAETLEIVRALGAKRTYLSHIEEPDRVSHDELLEWSEELLRGGLDVRFTYDTERIALDRLNSGSNVP